MIFIKDSLIKALNSMLRGALTSAKLSQKDKGIISASPLLILATDVQLSIAITVNGDDIVLSKVKENYPSKVVLRGTLATLISLAIAKDKQEAITSRAGLELQGDTAAMYTWQRAFQSLDIQWEKELNTRIGALPASLIIQFVNRVRKHAKQFAEQMPEKIHHSMVANNLAVDSDSFQQFSKEVQDLRLRVDKLRRTLGKV